MDHVLSFFTVTYPTFFQEHQLHKSRYPLEKFSMDLTVPYNGYVLRICVDLNAPLQSSYHVCVEVPDTDFFLPVQNDLELLHKAIQAIKKNDIPMYNRDTVDCDYVRMPGYM